MTLGLILALSGLGYVLIGLYGHFFLQMTGFGASKVTYAVIGVGFAVFWLAVWTCFAAATRNRAMLCCLAVSLPLVIIAIVGLGGSAFYFTPQITDQMEGKVNAAFEQLKLHPENDEYASKISTLQQYGICCGLNGPSWYAVGGAKNLRLPVSCCRDGSKDLIVESPDTTRATHTCYDSKELSRPLLFRLSKQVLIFDNDGCEDPDSFCYESVNTASCRDAVVGYSEAFMKFIWLISVCSAVCSILTLFVTCCMATMKRNKQVYV